MNHQHRRSTAYYTSFPSAWNKFKVAEKCLHLSEVTSLSRHKCRRSAPPLLDLPVDPLSHRLRMPRQHTAPARRPSQEERNGAQYIRPAGLAQIPDHFKPDPTAPSMKLNVCVRGSITNTEEAAVAAQYSIPSGPAQMPKYFRPPSSAPSMKLSVRAHGSITSTEEALNGEQYRSPSGPAQISLYFPLALPMGC